MRERSYCITSFCPNGMQIASPGGLSLVLEDISAVTSGMGNGHPWLNIYLRSGQTIEMTFHRNSNGGPPDVFQLHHNIMEQRAKVMSLNVD